LFHHQQFYAFLDFFGLRVCLHCAIPSPIRHQYCFALLHLHHNFYRHFRHYCF
jgi:hypothetical protein